MTLEEQLKAIILEKYKSVRAFTQEISVPYSSVDSILKRPNGIKNAGVSLMLKIFDALDLDIESIQTDTLAPKMHIPSDMLLTPKEKQMLDLHRKSSQQGITIDFESITNAIYKTLQDLRLLREQEEQTKQQRQKLHGDTDAAPPGDPGEHEGRKTP